MRYALGVYYTTPATGIVHLVAPRVDGVSLAPQTLCGRSTSDEGAFGDKTPNGFALTCGVCKGFARRMAPPPLRSRPARIGLAICPFPGCTARRGFWLDTADGRAEQYRCLNGHLSGRAGVSVALGPGCDGVTGTSTRRTPLVAWEQLEGAVDAVLYACVGHWVVADLTALAADRRQVTERMYRHATRQGRHVSISVRAVEDGFLTVRIEPS